MYAKDMCISFFFSILRSLGIETSGTLAGSSVKSLAARFRACEMALTDSWKRGV